MEALYDNPASRAGDLEKLEQIAAGYPTREAFLSELTLDPPEATGAEAGAPLLDEDYLILSTIHSAKGQEWESVFMLNVTDGCIPSDMATGSDQQIDEERRLLYVAMTRAKQHLHLIMPARFYQAQQRRYGDGHMFACRSRFLPDAILDRFEFCVWPVDNRAEEIAAPTLTRVDISARMRDRWK
jgi:DNA helicase-2/ATP-dependent DNA helicase PcrA